MNYEQRKKQIQPQPKKPLSEITDEKLVYDAMQMLVLTNNDAKDAAFSATSVELAIRSLTQKIRTYPLPQQDSSEDWEEIESHIAIYHTLRATAKEIVKYLKQNYTLKKK